MKVKFGSKSFILSIRTKCRNIFACPVNGASPFWKGVRWAAKAAKVGYMWKVGNGKKIKFWEDLWFGSATLATQIWDLYTISNDQGITISYAWGGVDISLKLALEDVSTLRCPRVWYDLISITSSVNLTEEEDTLIWKHESKGVYSASSLYGIVNFMWVIPINIPAVWKINVPPIIHIFLWLLINNKLLTRDNFNKRQHVPDLTCAESTSHLFLECVVTHEIWRNISLITKIGACNVHSISCWWVSDKPHHVANSVCAAVMWAIWHIRNDLCFSQSRWMGLQAIWRKIASHLDQWGVLFSGDVRWKK